MTREAPKGSPPRPIDAWIDRIIAMVRARLGHPLRVIKRQFGYMKIRCRGPAWNRVTGCQHPASRAPKGPSRDFGIAEPFDQTYPKNTRIESSDI
jgi:IS5 family transposase